MAVHLRISLTVASLGGTFWLVLEATRTHKKEEKKNQDHWQAFWVWVTGKDEVLGSGWLAGCEGLGASLLQSAYALRARAARSTPSPARLPLDRVPLAL